MRSLAVLLVDVTSCGEVLSAPSRRLAVDERGARGHVKAKRASRLGEPVRPRFQGQLAQSSALPSATFSPEQASATTSTSAPLTSPVHLSIAP